MLHKCCVWQNALSLFFNAGNVYCLFRIEHSMFLPLLIEKKQFFGCMSRQWTGFCTGFRLQTHLEESGAYRLPSTSLLKCKDGLLLVASSLKCIHPPLSPSSLTVVRQIFSSCKYGLPPSKFIPFNNFQLLFGSRL